MDAIWWHIFDLLGTTAFAVSGVFAALSRRMDLFGIFVLSAATAVGGGIVRDILIGNIPPAAFKNSIYLWIILGSIVIVTLTVRYFNIHMWRRFMGHLSAIYLLCDAIGLGSFTVTGTLLGCYYYPDYWILDITLGVLTAVGGGVIRDVLAGRIPVVLRTEVYATASLLGSVLLYGAVIPFEVPFEVGAIVSFSVTVAIRLVAIRFHLNVPRIRRKKQGYSF